MNRRLAAILVADVVGFSRLMAADEAGTISALRQRRADVLEPVLKTHKGRIVKLMGDGVLVELASAVNAVAAALELQRRMAEANEGVPDDRHIVLRVGINLGEVVGAGSDIYGDGVNIAARLEAIAEPGGICVSGKVREEVLGKTTANFEDMGEQSLKNIATPVRAWRVRVGVPASASSAAASPSMPAPPKRDTSKPSVAVLPFDNMSGDKDQEYFSDGITEDIVTALSRFRSLFVIARNSSFAFRGQGLTIPEIAKRLGVEYVVEGSVRRAGNRVRITAQLIEAESGKHVWAERYDRGLEDIFAVQEEVASTVASTLAGRVEIDIAQMNKAKRPGSVAAYELAMRGFHLHHSGGLTNEKEAIELCERAISLDPDYAEAYAGLAVCLAEFWYSDLDAGALERAAFAARRGAELDRSNAICQLVDGYCGLLRREFSHSEACHNRAVELNPNDPHVHCYIGYLLAMLGQAEQSEASLERANRLNAFPPPWYSITRGVAAFANRDYAKAIDLISPWSDSVYNLMYVAASLAYLGDIGRARAVLDECVRLKPDIPVIEFAKAEPYKNPADTEHLIEGLRKAGLDV